MSVAVPFTWLTDESHIPLVQPGSEVAGIVALKGVETLRDAVPDQVHQRELAVHPGCGHVAVRLSFGRVVKPIRRFKRVAGIKTVD